MEVDLEDTEVTVERDKDKDEAVLDPEIPIDPRQPRPTSDPLSDFLDDLRLPHSDSDPPIIPLVGFSLVLLLVMYSAPIPLFRIQSSCSVSSSFVFRFRPRLFR